MVDPDDYIDAQHLTPELDSRKLGREIAGTVIYWIVLPVVAFIELASGAITAGLSGIDEWLFGTQVATGAEGRRELSRGLLGDLWSLPESFIEGSIDGTADQLLEPLGPGAYVVSVGLVVALSYVTTRAVIWLVSNRGGVL